MRILFTMTPAFKPEEGGVQRTTFKLGKYFTKQGMDVSYYSTADKGHIRAEYGTLYHGNYPGDLN